MFKHTLKRFFCALSEKKFQKLDFMLQYDVSNLIFPNTTNLINYAKPLFKEESINRKSTPLNARSVSKRRSKHNFKFVPISEISQSFPGELKVCLEKMAFEIST